MENICLGEVKKIPCTYVWFLAGIPCDKQHTGSLARVSYTLMRDTHRISCFQEGSLGSGLCSSLQQRTINLQGSDNKRGPESPGRWCGKASVWETKWVKPAWYHFFCGTFWCQWQTEDTVLGDCPSEGHRRTQKDTLADFCHAFIQNRKSPWSFPCVCFFSNVISSK